MGKIDWELRKFHGDEYSTHRGSTYNSYLIKEEKIALIDTMWNGTRVMVDKIANGIINQLVAHRALWQAKRGDLKSTIFESKSLSEKGDNKEILK